MLGESGGEAFLRTNVEDQFGCCLVKRAVVCWTRARSEGVDREGVDSERHEANEEMLSDAPGRRGGDADADETVGSKAYACVVVYAVLEVDADLAM